MPIYGADGGIATAPEWQELAKKLHDGDGLLFAGDPRLYLQIGVLEGRNAYGRVVTTGRRLEVWRHNEDGSDAMIGHWHPSEQYRICMDLAEMRADRPGAVSALDRIDKHNDALEKAASDAYQAASQEMLEHALKLDHDRNNPRNTFYLAGRGAARA